MLSLHWRLSLILVPPDGFAVPVNTVSAPTVASNERQCSLGVRTDTVPFDEPTFDTGALPSLVDADHLDAACRTPTHTALVFADKCLDQDYKSVADISDPTTVSLKDTACHTMDVDDPGPACCAVSTTDALSTDIDDGMTHELAHLSSAENKLCHQLESTTRILIPSSQLICNSAMTMMITWLTTCNIQSALRNSCIISWSWPTHSLIPCSDWMCSSAMRLMMMTWLMS